MTTSFILPHYLLEVYAFLLHYSFFCDSFCVTIFVTMNIKGVLPMGEPPRPIFYLETMASWEECTVSL